MSADKKIFSNTIVQVAGKAVTSIIGFICVSFLTRYPGQIKFSEYTFVLNYAGFVFILADFGLNSLLIRTLASKDQKNYFFSQIFSFRVFLIIISTILSSILVLIYPIGINVTTGVLLTSMYNGAIILTSTFWCISQSQMRFDKVVISQVLTSITFLILISTGIYFNSNLIFFITANVLASFAGLLSSFLSSGMQIKLEFLRLNELKNIIKEAWPFAFGTLVSIAYFKIDSLMMAYYHNPSLDPAVGLYALAYRFFETVLVLGGYFTSTLFPYFSAHLHSANFSRHFLRYFIFSLLIGVGATLFLYFFANPLIILLGGDAFVKAIPSLQILSIAAGISILSGFFTSVAVAGHKEILLLKFAIFAFFINIILNYFILPNYSFIGASWITVITQSFILVTTAYSAFKVVNTPQK